MQHFEGLCGHRHLQAVHCLAPSVRQLYPVRRSIASDASSAQMYLTERPFRTQTRHMAATSARASAGADIADARAIAGACACGCGYECCRCVCADAHADADASARVDLVWQSAWGESVAESMRGHRPVVHPVRGEQVHEVGGGRAHRRVQQRGNGHEQRPPRRLHLPPPLHHYLVALRALRPRRLPAPRLVLPRLSTPLPSSNASIR